MTALAPLLFAASALLPPESFVREADGTFRCDLAKLGVPVDESVAAIFAPMWPLLPTPVTMSLPLQANIVDTALSKSPSK